MRLVAAALFRGHRSEDVLGVADLLARGGATVSHPETDPFESDEEIRSWASGYFNDWTGDGPYAVLGFGRGAVAALAAAQADPNVFLAVIVGAVGVDADSSWPHVQLEVLDDSATNEEVAAVALRWTIPAFIYQYLNQPWLPTELGRASVREDEPGRYKLELDSSLGPLALSAVKVGGSYRSAVDLEAEDLHLDRTRQSMNEALEDLRNFSMRLANSWGADASIVGLPTALQSAWSAVPSEMRGEQA